MVTESEQLELLCPNVTHKSASITPLSIYKDFYFSNPEYMFNECNDKGILFPFFNTNIYQDMFNKPHMNFEVELPDVNSNLYYPIPFGLDLLQSSMPGSEDYMQEVYSSVIQKCFQSSPHNKQENKVSNMRTRVCEIKQNRIEGLPDLSQLPAGMKTPRWKRTLLSQDPNVPIKYCQYCKQPFSRQNSLRRHEQLHSGLKPYQCLPCNRQFSRQDIYKRHCASKRCQRLTKDSLGIL